MKPEILINPEMRWACIASDAAKLKFIDGMRNSWPALPEVNEVLQVPFIVNPESQQPVPVRVEAIHKLWGTTGHVMVVVVAAADQTH